MLDEALRQRLETLNRGVLPEPCPAAHPTAATSTKIEAAPAAQQQLPAGKPIPGIVRMGEVITTPAGEHLRIALPIDSLWPNGTQLVTGRQTQLRHLLQEASQAVEPTVLMDAEFAALVAAMPERMLLLDLETCGLGGAALFLAGILRSVDGVPTVELLLARNYAEEQAVLETLWQIVAGQEVLVTFNGKAFDWPMVLDRSARYRLAAARGPQKLLHVDMLHHARRRWRRQLPDCRLQTLEQVVCRRTRTGDIPGHRIPAAYADFVRTGFERDMEAILYHNAMDLVTLLDLTLRLAG
ncbi:MAG: ribonuclease H-like domain-containing protein [Pirellulales bacterium]